MPAGVQCTQCIWFALSHLLLLPMQCRRYLDGKNQMLPALAPLSCPACVILLLPPPAPSSCRYLDGKNQMLYPEPRDVFPCDLIHSGQSYPAMELSIATAAWLPCTACNRRLLHTWPHSLLSLVHCPAALPVLPSPLQRSARPSGEAQPAPAEPQAPGWPAHVLMRYATAFCGCSRVCQLLPGQCCGRPCFFVPQQCAPPLFQCAFFPVPSLPPNSLVVSFHDTLRFSLPGAAVACAFVAMSLRCPT